VLPAVVRRRTHLRSAAELHRQTRAQYVHTSIFNRCSTVQKIVTEIVIEIGIEQKHGYFNVTGSTVGYTKPAEPKQIFFGK